MMSQTGILALPFTDSVCLGSLFKVWMLLLLFCKVGLIMPISEVSLRIKCDNDVKHLLQSALHNNIYHCGCLVQLQELEIMCIKCLT